MLRLRLNDDQWSRIAVFLQRQRIHVKSKKCRMFVEAVLWKSRVGGAWRDLPTEFGSSSTVFNRFNRWSKKGIWKMLFFELRTDVDTEWHFMDSTVVDAHQHSSGAASTRDEDIGRSCGGLTTKIHAIVDSCGNPVELVLTPGQTHDSQIAEHLIESTNAETYVADKAYHAQNIRDKIVSKNSTAIIPLKSNSIDKLNSGFDKDLYKLRHLVENFFARIKHFRGVATRYDKLSRNFMSIVYLACAEIWSKI